MTVSPHTIAIAIVVALVPLAFDPGGMFPFGPIKWVLATVGVFVATALLFRQPEIRVHRTSAIGWGAFLVVGAMSAVAGLDPIHAWLGTPDRHLGMIAYLIFGLAFLVGQNIDEDRQLLGRAAVVGLSGIGVYTLAELTGVAPVSLVIASDRLGGPFGSPSYLGAACVLLVPIAVGVGFDVDQSRRWRVFAFLAATTGLGALIGSQSRAALIGLAVGVALLVPIVTRRRVAVLAGIILLAGAVLLTPAGARLLKIADVTSSDSRGRLDEWRIGVRVLVAHPILGVGPEGYRIAFPAAVDADYERRYTRQVTPDRAHNGLLDSGISTGVPGLVLYSAALGWLAVRGLRATRTGAPTLIGIAAGVVGYLAHQQFLFPLAEVDPVLWVMAGSLVTATNRPGATMVWHRSRTIAVAAGAIGVLVLMLGSLELVADRRAARSYQLLGTGAYTAAVASADGAALLRPDSIRYWFVAADVVSRPGSADDLAAAMLRVDRALLVSPGDPILLATRSGLLLDRAQVTGSSSDLGLALVALSELTASDRNNAGHRLSLGLALVLAGDLEGAEREWLISQDLAPGSPVPSINLTRLYLEQGRLAEAEASYRRALSIDSSAEGLVDLATLLNVAGVEVPLP